MESCYRISVILTALLALGASHPFNYHPEQWPVDQEEIQPTYYRHQGQEWPNAYAEAHFPGQIQARHKYRPDYSGYTPELPPEPIYKDPVIYHYQAYPPINQHKSSDVSSHTLPITVPVRSKTFEIVTSNNGVGDPIVHFPVGTKPEHVRIFRLDANGNIVRRNDGSYDEVPESVRKYLSMRGMKTGEQIESGAQPVASASPGTSASDNSLAPRPAQKPSEPKHKRPTPKAVPVLHKSSFEGYPIFTVPVPDDESQGAVVPRSDDTCNTRHEPVSEIDSNDSSFDHTPTNSQTPRKDSITPIPYPTTNKDKKDDNKDAKTSSGKQPGSNDSRAPKHTPESKVPVSVLAKPTLPDKENPAAHPIGNHDQLEPKKKSIPSLPTKDDGAPVLVTDSDSDESLFDYTPNHTPESKPDSGEIDDTSNESREPVSEPDPNKTPSIDQTDPKDSRAAIDFPTTNTDRNSATSGKQPDSSDSSTSKYKRELEDPESAPAKHDKKNPAEHRNVNHDQPEPNKKWKPALPEKAERAPAPVTELNSDDSSFHYTPTRAPVSKPKSEKKDETANEIREPASNQTKSTDPRESRAPIAFPTTNTNRTTSSNKQVGNDLTAPNYRPMYKVPFSFPAKPTLPDKKYRATHRNANYYQLEPRYIPLFPTRADREPAPVTDPDSDESSYDYTPTRAPISKPNPREIDENSNESREPESKPDSNKSPLIDSTDPRDSRAPIPFPTTNTGRNSTKSGKQPESNDSSTPKYKRELKAPVSAPAKQILPIKKQPYPIDHHDQPEPKQKSKPALSTKVDKEPVPVTDSDSDEALFNTTTKGHEPHKDSKAPIAFPFNDKATNPSSDKRPDSKDSPSHKSEPESKVPVSAPAKPSLPYKKDPIEHRDQPEPKQKSKPALPTKVDKEQDPVIDSESDEASFDTPTKRHEPQKNSKTPKAFPSDNKDKTVKPSSGTKLDNKGSPAQKPKPEPKIPVSALTKPSLPDKKDLTDYHDHPDPKQKSKPALLPKVDKEPVPVTDSDSDEALFDTTTKGHEPRRDSKAPIAFPFNDKATNPSSDKRPDSKDSAAHNSEPESKVPVSAPAKPSSPYKKDPIEHHDQLKPKQKSKPALPTKVDKEPVPVTDTYSEEAPFDTSTKGYDPHKDSKPPITIQEKEKPIDPSKGKQPDGKDSPGHKPKPESKVPVSAPVKPSLPDKKDPSDNNDQLKPNKTSKHALPTKDDKAPVSVTDSGSDEALFDTTTKGHEPRRDSKAPIAFPFNDKATNPSSDKRPDSKDSAAHNSEPESKVPVSAPAKPSSPYKKDPIEHHDQLKPKQKSKPALPTKVDKEPVPVTDTYSEEAPFDTSTKGYDPHKDSKPPITIQEKEKPIDPSKGKQPDGKDSPGHKPKPESKVPVSAPVKPSLPDKKDPSDNNDQLKPNKTSKHALPTKDDKAPVSVTDSGSDEALFDTTTKGHEPRRDSKAPIAFPFNDKATNPSSDKRPDSKDSPTHKSEPESKVPVSAPAKPSSPYKKDPTDNHDKPEPKQTSKPALPTKVNKEPVLVTDSDSDEASFDTTTKGHELQEDSEPPKAFPYNDKAVNPSSGKKPDKKDSPAHKPEPEPKVPVSAPAKPSLPDKKDPTDNHDQPEPKKTSKPALPTKVNKAPVPVIDSDSDEAPFDTPTKGHEPEKDSKTPKAFPSDNKDKTVKPSSGKKLDDKDSPAQKPKPESKVPVSAPVKPSLPDKKDPSDNNDQLKPNKTSKHALPTKDDKAPVSVTDSGSDEALFDTTTKGHEPRRDSKAPIAFPFNDKATNPSSDKRPDSKDSAAHNSEPESKVPVSAPAKPSSPYKKDPIEHHDQLKPKQKSKPALPTKVDKEPVPVTDTYSEEAPFDTSTKGYDPHKDSKPPITIQEKEKPIDPSKGKQPDGKDSPGHKPKPESKVPVSAPVKPSLPDKKDPSDNNDQLKPNKTSKHALPTKDDKAPVSVTDSGSDEALFDTTTKGHEPRRDSKAPIAFPFNDKATNPSSDKRPDSKDSAAHNSEPESKVPVSAPAKPSSPYKKDPIEHHDQLKPKQKSKPALPTKVDKEPVPVTDTYSEEAPFDTSTKGYDPHKDSKPPITIQEKEKPIDPSKGKQPDGKDSPGHKPKPESKVPVSAPVKPSLPDKKDPSDNNDQLKPNKTSKHALPTKDDKAPVSVTDSGSDEALFDTTTKGHEPRRDSKAPIAFPFNDKATNPSSDKRPDSKDSPTHKSEPESKVPVSAPAKPSSPYKKDPTDNHDKPEPKQTSKPALPTKVNKEPVLVTDSDSDEASFDTTTKGHELQEDSEPPKAFPYNDKAVNPSSGKKPDKKDSPAHKPEPEPKVPVSAPAKPSLPDKKDPTDNHDQPEPKKTSKPALPTKVNKAPVPVIDSDSDEAPFDTPTKGHEPEKDSKTPKAFPSDNKDKTVKPSSGKKLDDKDSPAQKPKPESKVPVSAPGKPSLPDKKDPSDNHDQLTPNKKSKPALPTKDDKAPVSITDSDSDEALFDTTTKGHEPRRDSKAPIAFPFNDKATNPSSDKRPDSKDSPTHKSEPESKVPVSAPAKPSSPYKKDPTDNHDKPEPKQTSKPALPTKVNKEPVPVTDSDSDEASFDTTTKGHELQEDSEPPKAFPYNDKAVNPSSGKKPDKKDSPAHKPEPEPKVPVSAPAKPSLPDKKDPTDNHDQPEPKKTSKPALPTKVNKAPVPVIDSDSDEAPFDTPTKGHEPEKDSKTPKAFPSDNKDKTVKPSSGKKLDDKDSPAQKPKPESKVPVSAPGKPSLPDKKDPSDNHDQLTPNKKSKPALPTKDDKAPVSITDSDSDEALFDTTTKGHEPRRDSKAPIAFPFNDKAVNPSSGKKPDKKDSPAHKPEPEPKVPVSAPAKPSLPDKKDPTDNHDQPEPKKTSKPALPTKVNKAPVPVIDSDSDEAPFDTPTKGHEPEKDSKTPKAFSSDNKDKTVKPSSGTKLDNKGSPAQKPKLESKVPWSAPEKPSLPDKKDPIDNYDQPGPKKTSKPALPTKVNKAPVPVIDSDSDEAPFDTPTKGHEPEKDSKTPKAFPSDNKDKTVKPSSGKNLDDKDSPAQKPKPESKVPVSAPGKPSLPDKKDPSDNHDQLKPNKKSKPALPTIDDKAPVLVTDSGSDDSPFETTTKGHERHQDSKEPIAFPNNDKAINPYSSKKPDSKDSPAQKPEPESKVPQSAPAKPSLPDKKDPTDYHDQPEPKQTSKHALPTKVDKAPVPVTDSDSDEAPFDTSTTGYDPQKDSKPPITIQEKEKPIDPSKGKQPDGKDSPAHKPKQESKVPVSAPAKQNLPDKNNPKYYFTDNHNQPKSKKSEPAMTTKAPFPVTDPNPASTIKPNSKKPKLDDISNESHEPSGPNADESQLNSDSNEDHIEQTTIGIEKKNEKVADTETTVATDKEPVQEKDNLKSGEKPEAKKPHTEEKKKKENADVKADNKKNKRNEERARSSEENSSEKITSEEKKELTNYVVNELKNRKTDEKHKKKVENSANWIWDLLREGIIALLSQRKKT